MSTYWYYECLDHVPPIQSTDEFTQHTDDASFKQGVALAHLRPLDPDSETVGNFGMEVHLYFAANARRFLVAHPSCRLAIVNEYGEHRPLPERLVPAGSKVILRHNDGSLLVTNARGDGKFESCHIEPVDLDWINTYGWRIESVTEPVNEGTK